MLASADGTLKPLSSKVKPRGIPLSKWRDQTSLVPTNGPVSVLNGVDPSTISDDHPYGHLPGWGVDADVSDKLNSADVDHLKAVAIVEAAGGNSSLLDDWHCEFRGAMTGFFANKRRGELKTKDFNTVLAYLNLRLPAGFSPPMLSVETLHDAGPALRPNADTVATPGGYSGSERAISFPLPDVASRLQSIEERVYDDEHDGDRSAMTFAHAPPSSCLSVPAFACGGEIESVARTTATAHKDVPASIQVEMRLRGMSPIANVRLLQFNSGDQVPSKRIGLKQAVGCPSDSDFLIDESMKIKRLLCLDLGYRDHMWTWITQMPELDVTAVLCDSEVYAASIGYLRNDTYLMHMTAVKEGYRGLGLGTLVRQAQINFAAPTYVVLLASDQTNDVLTRSSLDAQISMMSSCGYVLQHRGRPAESSILQLSETMPQLRLKEMIERGRLTGLRFIRGTMADSPSLTTEHGPEEVAIDAHGIPSTAVVPQYLYLACLKPTVELSFKSLSLSQKMDGQVLFVASHDVADRYLGLNQTPYRVEFAFSLLLINGFQQYGRLVQLEPRLSEVIYYETTTNGTGWCRRSDMISDASIFGSLANKLPDHYGLQFVGFRNFHDEIILFDRDAVIIRQCVRKDLSWVPTATCTAQLMPVTGQLNDLVEGLHECLNDDTSLVSPQ